MKSVWIIHKVSPYSSIGALAGSLGSAVRIAKKEEPDAEWKRISHASICGDDGYMLEGKLKMSVIYRHDYGREVSHICYRFIKRPLPSLPQSHEGERK